MLANYKIRDNASVTFNFQEVASDWRGGTPASDQITDEYTLALLTQPLNSNNFGLNLELSYLDTEKHTPNNTSGLSPAYDHAWIGAFEGIIIIP